MEREPTHVSRPNSWKFFVRIVPNQTAASAAGGSRNRAFREEFWNDVIGVRELKTNDGIPYQSLPSETVIADAERELRTRFGEILVARLKRIAGNPSDDFAERGGVARSRPFFVVLNDLSYGSLLLDLTLFGVRQFLSVFENDIDMASEALRGSVRGAFGDILATEGYRDAIDSISDVECDTAPLRGFLPAEPHGNPHSVPEPKSEHKVTAALDAVTRTRPQREELLRLAANATLLFPVLLALYVLAIAFSSLREQKAALDKQVSDFMSQQQVAMQRERASLDKQTEEIRRAQGDIVVRYSEQARFWREVANGSASGRR